MSGIEDNAKELAQAIQNKPETPPAKIDLKQEKFTDLIIEKDLEKEG
jgi:hypothetical protein